VSLDFDDLISEFTTRNAQREPLQRSVTPSVHTRQTQNNLDPISIQSLKKGVYKKASSFPYFASRTSMKIKNRSTNA
jgi:hypothetical protein